MFETIKHWLEDSHNQAKLFEHEDEELLHVALASLLYRMMMANNDESHHEIHEFSRILKHEFDLSNSQIEALHARVKTISCPLDHDLETIADYLKNKPMVKLNFMDMLNRMMSIDGFDPQAMDIFYRTQHVLFPEIKQDGF